MTDWKKASQLVEELKELAQKYDIAFVLSQAPKSEPLAGAQPFYIHDVLLKTREVKEGVYEGADLPSGEDWRFWCDVRSGGPNGPRISFLWTNDAEALFDAISAGDYRACVVIHEEGQPDCTIKTFEEAARWYEERKDG